MKILLATYDLKGHALPASAVVHHLRDRAHRVDWYSGPTTQSIATAVNATPHVSEMGFDTAPAQLGAWLERFDAMRVPQSQEFGALIKRLKPEIVFADSTMLGAKDAAHAYDIPLVELGVLPIVSYDTRAALVLQGAFKGCEAVWPYPNLVFCGPFLPRPTKWLAPKWFRTLDVAKPWVVVTSGTLVGQQPLQDIVLEAFAASGLGDEVELLIHDNPERHPNLPAWAHVHDWYSWRDVLPRSSLFITNGGYGAVSEAWAAGCPIIVAGTTEDKLLVGDRVDWISGTGINLGTDTPTAGQIVGASRAILTYPRFHTAAQAVRYANEGHDGALYAVRILEEWWRERVNGDRR